MNEDICIAIDAMGGDRGPEIVLKGAAIAHKRRPNTRFMLFGDAARIGPLLEAHAALKRTAKIVHTEISIQMDEKPSQALRRGRNKSSMWMAIDAVKTGQADVIVSAGNTGALMAMSTFCLRTMPGVSRPAIAAIWPTLRGESIVLDVGATIGADAAQLVEFAVMGAAMARILFDVERPSVGLLNIGVEEVKGNEYVKEAGRRLRAGDWPELDYRGFVEGNDLGKGVVDVVVTEGFAGNIALKTAEGTARQVGEYLSSAMRRTLSARIGYLLARGAFNALRAKMNPSSANGGTFLGLNGIVIKSHGGADAEGFAAAIELGYEVVRDKLLSRIKDMLPEGQGVSLARGSVAL